MLMPITKQIIDHNYKDIYIIQLGFSSRFLILLFGENGQLSDVINQK
jgi:hypothetical protein